MRQTCQLTPLILFLLENLGNKIELNKKKGVEVNTFTDLHIINSTQKS